MIRPKTEEEIELLRINGDLVSQTLAEVGKLVAPGVTTAKLCEVAETFIRDHGAVPSFKGYDGFPAKNYGQWYHSCLSYGRRWLRTSSGLTPLLSAIE